MLIWCGWWVWRDDVFRPAEGDGNYWLLGYRLLTAAHPFHHFRPCTLIEYWSVINEAINILSRYRYVADCLQCFRKQWKPAKPSGNADFFLSLRLICWSTYSGTFKLFSVVSGVPPVIFIVLLCAQPCQGPLLQWLCIILLVASVPKRPLHSFTHHDGEQFTFKFPALSLRHWCGSSASPIGANYIRPT